MLNDKHQLLPPKPVPSKRGYTVSKVEGKGPYSYEDGFKTAELPSPFKAPKLTSTSFHTAATAAATNNLPPVVPKSPPPHRVIDTPAIIPVL